MHAWSWGDWQQTIFQRKPIRLALFDGDKPLLLGQGLILQLPFGFSYVYFPYGPIPLSDFSEKKYLEYLTSFTGLIKKEFSHSFFARIEPMQTLATEPTGSYHFKNVQPQSTLILDLKKDAETLLSEMHSKTRYNIKLAQRHSVQVEITTDEQQMNEAIDLIVKTGERQSYHGYSKAYYQKLINFFRNNPDQAITISVYIAHLHREILASAIMLDYKDTRIYLFGGSSDNKRQVMAPHLLHWQAIQDAQNNGITKYDFWGLETAAGKESGFVRFKMGFGGEVKHYGGAWDLPLNTLTYSAYRALHKILSFVR